MGPQIRGPNPRIETLSQAHLAGKEQQSGEKMERAIRPEIPSASFRRVLRKSARTDSAGARFMAALSQWVERILAEGSQIVGDRGMPLEDFIHPLCAT
jgi:hypothetical protein